MNSSRNDGLRLKRLAVVSNSGKEELAACDVQSTFDGTIASACESVGISLEQMIEMMRWAKESDSRVAQFLDAWDTLDSSERQASETADAVRQKVGLAPVDLLRVVAEVTFRIAMFKARIIAATDLPSVVERSVETALTAEGIVDRKMLFQHSGFLPTPKGLQTTINVAQNAQANARPVVTAPSPEQTIRQLAEAFNQPREMRRALVAKSSEPVPIEDSNREGDDGE